MKSVLGMKRHVQFARHALRNVGKLDERVALHLAGLDLVGVGEVEADSADQQLPPEECAALRGEGVYVVGDKRNRNP